MRIKWLDGLKGLACFAVLWHHFMLAFVPGQYNGTIGRWHGFDLVQNPLTFIVNGNFMVCLFMILSGMAAAISIMNMNDKDKLADIFKKRYPRLMLPVLPIAIITWIFSRFGLFLSTDVAAYTQSGYMLSWYSEPVSLFAALRSALLTSWYSTDVTVSGVFWVLPYFMWGFVFACILSIVAWKRNNKTIIFYLIAMILTGLANSYFMAFVLGVIIVFIREQYALINSESRICKIVGILLLVIGLILGGYPSGVTPTNFYGLFPSVEGIGLTNFSFYHVIGAALVIYSIYDLKWIQKLFELKIFQLCGRISYEVFLVHMLIMCSVSCMVYKLMFVSANAGYMLSVVVTFVITNIVVFVVASLYKKVISLIKY